MQRGERDQTIDGLRAVAALGVVFAHAVNYRFAQAPIPGMHSLQRLAEPLAQTSVQIFFVISGFIITTLLLKEEREHGRFSLAAFYIRRAFRIIPPLAATLLALALLSGWQFIALDRASLVWAATFTCNTSFADCRWWVAHTWSLAVEEQFYLAWPLVLSLIPRRTPFLAIAIAVLLLAFLVAPLTWHSNYISFICIGAGAVCATSSNLRMILARAANGPALIAALSLLVAGPLFLPAKLAQAMMPFIIVYVVFAAREVAVARWILALTPVQAIGLGSYSLYLWQQVFLATPSLYAKPFPLWLLPVAVVASVLLVERPFIRAGRTISIALARRSQAQEAPATGPR